MRKQFTDCFTTAPASTLLLTASNTLNNSVNSSHFDTNECYSPSIIVNVLTLANNKTIGLKIQHSDTNTSADFVDLTKDEESNARSNLVVNSTGISQIYYAGQKRYIRLQLVSTTASPGSTINVYYQQHNLINKPSNAGL